MKQSVEFRGMAKRKADFPLHALSPNESLSGTRRSSRITPASRWPQGKENDNVRDSSTLVKSQLKKSKLRSGGESAGKRSRLGVDARSQSDPSAAQKKRKSPPKEYSWPGNAVSTVRKDNSCAELRRSGTNQTSGGLCQTNGCFGGIPEGQDDFTDLAAMHSGGPEELGRAETRTCDRASPSGPISEGQELPSRKRELDCSGVGDLETCSESTSEEKGSSENQLVELRDKDSIVTPDPVKAKEDPTLLAKSIDKNEEPLYHIAKNDRSLRDGPGELTVADHHSPVLQEPAGSHTPCLMENGSGGNLASHKTSVATEEIVAVTRKNSRGTDGREVTNGALPETLPLNEERCPTCSGVGRPSVDVEAARQVLEEAYSKLYAKYQNSKTRNLAEVEALYDEQTRKFEAFSTAADALVEKLRQENNFLIRQLQETGGQESINRSRKLEEEFIECRNDLVIERSKVLELEQELEEAHICILGLRRSLSAAGPVFNSTSDVPAQQSGDPEASQVTKPPVITEPPSFDIGNVRSSKSPSVILEKDEKTKKSPGGIESEHTEKVSSAEGALSSAERTEIVEYASQPDAGPFPTGRGGSKLMHELLQILTQMSTFVEEESSRVIFTHDDSGLSFKLEQNSISREVGGEDALLYHILAPGTILHLGPAWMQSEIVFDIVQADVFFQRILAVVLGCHPD